MMSEINMKLKSMLSEHRYEHSLGVQETAIKLANQFHADVDKACIAGLVHDCAKGFSNETLLKMAVEYGVDINEVYRFQPELLHGPVGAYVAQMEFNIDDEEILHAIRYHTTGCENMSLLDKIIYIADYIEPGRNFPGVDALRQETYNDIDRGVLMALDNTIKYVIERRQLIDVLTIKARNFILSSPISMA
jgi:predicted HD superfamily hydrolase involved in NAD metabolism